MTQTTHTPGPWRVGLDKNSVRDADEGYIADCQNRFADKTTVEANARLIAAAPELLEALKMARQYAPKYNFYPDGSVMPGASEQLQQIDAAIAKAEQVQA